jgi:hypothetical protein
MRSARFQRALLGILPSSFSSLPNNPKRRLEAD